MTNGKITKGTLVEPQAIIKEMLFESKTYDLDGKLRRVTGAISSAQADFMADLIKTRKLARCLETGVAHGVSTVAICAALSELEKTGLKCKHFGVDPCQYSEFNGAGLAALRRCGISHLFELLDGPSHLMLPKVIERGEKIDMVFVDGWHTFDYTLIDVFLADKLLRPGGILMMHDMPMPSKQKVWGYLRTHRKYRLLAGPMRPLSRRLLSWAKYTIVSGPRMGLVRLNQSELLVAEKIKDFEPNYDYFRNF
jgi:predicted O-methyltransferase YrrM